MLRKFVIVVGLLTVALVAVAGLAAWRATSAPAWYEPGASEAPAAQEPSLAGSLGSLFGIDLGGAARAGFLVQRLLADGRVELDAAQLADVVHTALSGDRGGRALLEAAGPLQARIADGRVEVGALVDLTDLRAERVDPDVAAVLDTLRSWAPFLVDGERWVGLRGIPAVVDGDLGLGDGASLRIGRLGLPLELLVPGAEGDPLRRRLTLDLKVLDLTRVAVAGDRVVVEGGPVDGR